MNWLGKYIGVPWGELPTGMKCWDLVKAVYKERLDIDLKDYKGVDTSDVIDLLRTAKEFKRDYKSPPWTQVYIPGEFDVVVMHGHIKGEKVVRAPIHAGVFVQGRLLHIEEETVGSVWVKLGHYSVSRRIVAFCRHERMMKGGG